MVQAVPLSGSPVTLVDDGSGVASKLAQATTPAAPRDVKSITADEKADRLLVVNGALLIALCHAFNLPDTPAAYIAAAQDILNASA